MEAPEGVGCDRYLCLFALASATLVPHGNHETGQQKQLRNQISVDCAPQLQHCAAATFPEQPDCE
jgi:hypothetical protein